jgi:hypothetical protein
MTRPELFEIASNSKRVENILDLFVAQRWGVPELSSYLFDAVVGIFLDQRSQDPGFGLLELSPREHCGALWIKVSGILRLLIRNPCDYIREH